MSSDFHHVPHALHFHHRLVLPGTNDFTVIFSDEVQARLRQMGREAHPEPSTANPHYGALIDARVPYADHGPGIFSNSDSLPEAEMCFGLVESVKKGLGEYYSNVKFDCRVLLNKKFGTSDIAPPVSFFPAVDIRVPGFDQSKLRNDLPLIMRFVPVLEPADKGYGRIGPDSSKTPLKSWKDLPILDTLDLLRRPSQRHDGPRF